MVTLVTFVAVVTGNTATVRFCLYGYSVLITLSGGRVVRAPGRVTCIPPWNGFETHHGLMPRRYQSLYQNDV